MRKLLLFRGAPGAGKSTFIKNNNLENYTLSADSIRMLYSYPKLKVDGTFEISNKNDHIVWDILMQILELRMQNGEFTVIDATNSKTSDMKKYKNLADKYRYRCYIIDFTDISIDVCKKQNKSRDSLKIVPEAAIDNMYARFKTQKVPAGIEVLTRDNWSKILENEIIDLNDYEKIVHFGDIHGCYSTLKKYFDEFPFNKNYYYYFCGDYIDRGSENYETLKFLNELKDQPNVCLIEGNHESYISKYGNNEISPSKVFEKKTKKELIEKGFTESDARSFYRKIRQMSYYNFLDKTILVCHGGIPFSKDLKFATISTETFIKGVGRYEDHLSVDETWNNEYCKENNLYMIHGHRNVLDSPIRANPQVFNLEGKIEFGGDLRIVEINKDGSFTTREYKNDKYIKPKNYDKIDETESSILEILKNNKSIYEKVLNDHISSFNFTRDAFVSKNWNDFTVLARGLFMNTITSDIVARGYEKFFNIDEREETNVYKLYNRIKDETFSSYIKENGYLGIVSYDKYIDDIFIASKSTDNSEHAQKIKEILESKYNLEKIKNWLKNNNYTLLFEIIEPNFDPHIIEYKESKVVLLDAVENTLKFSKLSYDNLIKLSDELSIPVKKFYKKFSNPDEFLKEVNNIKNTSLIIDGEDVEGLVFEGDNTGFMFKLKSGYYNQWKKLRSVADQTLKKGYIAKTSQLTISLENLFYGFCKKLYEENTNKEHKYNIIELRNLFYKNNEK